MRGERVTTTPPTQANATNQLHEVLNIYHFSRGAKRIYEKAHYSHVFPISSITVTPGRLTGTLRNIRTTDRRKLSQISNLAGWPSIPLTCRCHNNHFLVFSVSQSQILSSSLVRIQRLCRVLNSAHLKCEAILLPPIRQRPKRF
ncbi:hypothetical protein T265_12629, partial [Opisthorchis viverrini]